MDLEAYENHIVTRLLQELDPQNNELIRAMYDSQGEKEDGVARPVVLVSFKRTEFRQPYEQDSRYFYDTNGTAQDATVYFEVIFNSTKRRGITGIYGLRKRVLDALNSWKHPMADRVFPVSDSNVELDGNIWMWSTVYGTKFISVPGYEEPEDLLDEQDPGQDPATLQVGEFLNEETGDVLVTNPAND